MGGATIRLNLPETGVRLANNGKWAAIVMGQFKGEYKDKDRAIRRAGTDKVLK